MKTNADSVKSTPLKNARELAAMLKRLPRDERLRIEGAIAWAGVARNDRLWVEQAQDSA